MEARCYQRIEHSSNCMSKNGSGGKFRVVCILSQLKKKEADGSHSGGSQSRDPKVGLPCLGVLGLVGCSLLILCRVQIVSWEGFAHFGLCRHWASVHPENRSHGEAHSYLAEHWFQSYAYFVQFLKSESASNC